MGTSRGYTAPTNGNWPSLKRDVTQFGVIAGEVNDLDNPDDFTPDQSLSTKRFLASYIQTYGGSAAVRQTFSGGGSGGGSGGTSTRVNSIGRSATRVGRNLGRFAARVGEVGLDTTLKEFGLEHLVGRSAQEVYVGIIDVLVGPNSTMDDDLARDALLGLRREQFAEAVTAEDIDGILNETLGRIEVSGLVMQFYGHYLFLMFCRDFYERLEQKIGQDKTARSIESIRRTIKAALENELVGFEATEIDWNHTEGQELAGRILLRTFEIFEVSE